MSDALPIAPPTNGAHPTTPQKPAAVKPVDAKPVAPVKEVKAPEVDDSEEYEHVVNGQTVKVRLTKAQRAIEFQKSRAASQKFKEAADMRAKVDDFNKSFDVDPEEAIRRLGKDPDKVFAAHLEKKAKLALMTQEQRDAAALQDRLSAAEAKAKSYEQKEAEAKQAQIDGVTFKRYEKELIEASDKVGLDSGGDVLEELADIGLEYLQNGIPLTGDQIVEVYRQKHAEFLEARDKKLLGVLKGDKLLKYLGPAALAEVKAALSQADADSLKDIPKPKTKVAVKAHERAVKGHISENDFDRKFKL